MALRRRRAPMACAEPTTGPHTLATPCPVLQWLVFGGALSPADLHIRAATAWEHHDYAEALRLWSQAVSLQPGNAELHYLRGRAPATLGLRASAADAFQVTLLLEPQSAIAREAMAGRAAEHPWNLHDGDREPGAIDRGSAERHEHLLGHRAPQDDERHRVVTPRSAARARRS